MLIKIILLYYLMMSCVSAVMHLVDKRRAIRGTRRIPERSLHSMELIGGWPGAIATTRWIRHKTSKRSYMITLYAIAISHGVFWMLMLRFATRG